MIRVTVIMVSLQMSYKKYEYWHVPDGLMMLVLATVMCQEAVIIPIIIKVAIINSFTATQNN